MRYKYTDLLEKRKLLVLLFSLETPDRGEEFNDSVRNMCFSKLNNFLLNTDIGREHFPGLTLKNLEFIYKEVNKISPFDNSARRCPHCYNLRRI